MATDYPYTLITGAHCGQTTELQFNKTELPAGVSNPDDIRSFFAQKIEDNKNFRQLDKIQQRYFNSVFGDMVNMRVDTKSVPDKVVLTNLPEKPNSDYKEEDVKSILENTQVTGVTQNHNESLGILDQARKKGLLKEPMTLLHFDTHSDLFSVPTSRHSIADWINATVMNGDTSEIYWVLPDWTKDDKARDEFWEKYKTGITRRELVIFTTPKDGNIYVNKNPKTSYDNRISFFEEPEDYETNKDNYRVVKFHKVTIDELPSFKDDKRVYLDFDSDYFSNSGHETAGGVISKNNLTSQELSETFSKTVRVLNEKDVKPLIFSGTMSPEFLPDEDIPDVKRFYQDFVKNSPTPKP